MTIRFNESRRLYISGGALAIVNVTSDENVEVSQIVESSHQDLVDIYFANGTVAFGCLSEWYVIIENGVAVKKLAYVSKMDKLPLP